MNSPVGNTSPPFPEGSLASEAVVGLNERQRQILGSIQGQGYVTVETLASRFDVTMQTIRRDIIRLESLGLLQRFHGGAGLRSSATRLEYAEKRTVAIDAKGRIARTAAALVPDGASVFLDVGTTVEAIAHALRGRTGLRVFTCSVRAAAILAGCPGIELFVSGGFVRGVDGSLVGEVVSQTLEGLRPDFAFIGFSGYDDDGAPMDFDLQKVSIKRAVIGRANSALLVGDAGKYQHTATMRIVPLTALHGLVSDAPPPETLGRQLTASGVAFHLAR